MKLILIYCIYRLIYYRLILIPYILSLRFLSETIITQILKQLSSQLRSFVALPILKETCSHRFANGTKHSVTDTVKKISVFHAISIVVRPTFKDFERELKL